MKNKIFIIAFFLIDITGFSQSQITYKQFNKTVSLNPNADHDLQLIADYLQALTVAGDVAKARSFLSPTALTYGPGGKDSINSVDDLQNWEKSYQVHLDRKINYVSMTWRALQEGFYKGDWVANWGIYSFTDKDSGKRMDVSYHFVSKIVNGKISTSWLYYDKLGTMLESGFTMQPPSKH